MNIAFVVPSLIGGPRETVRRLFKGLLLEGYKIDIFTLRRDKLPLLSEFGNDLFMIKTMLTENYDAVIYFGSIPLPSMMFIDCPKKALFVHGFIEDELKNAIVMAHTRAAVGALGLLAYYKLVKPIFSKGFFYDFTICRSVTSCEKNNLDVKSCVILPHFIFPEEVKRGKEFYNVEASGLSKNVVLSYSSYAHSPRLFGNHNVVKVFLGVTRRLNKPLKLIIVDPKISLKYTESYGSLLSVDYSPAMPKKEFLKMLTSSSLYFDQLTDEELRNSTIEAGVGGVPVAKYIHPLYVTRQDYGREEVIYESDIHKLIDALTEYFSRLDYYLETYAKNFKRFLATKRIWDYVKRTLIKELNKDK
ncbi:MAG: hypothetical protein J7K59_07660 [Candidatus Korarchaeota archaeon]|nr:hypothetical protein [Candidatus Korarchaeota archaeon]